MNQNRKWISAVKKANARQHSNRVAQVFL